jgi:hypothetical protein
MPTGVFLHMTNYLETFYYPAVDRLRELIDRMDEERQREEPDD